MTKPFASTMMPSLNILSIFCFLSLFQVAATASLLQSSSLASHHSSSSRRSSSNLHWGGADANKYILMERIFKVVSHDSIQESIADSNSSQQEQRISLRRNLAIGDFEELNQLFKGAVLKLPDASTSASLLFTLNLDMRNLRCTDISVGDIIITYSKNESNQQLTFRIDVVDLDLTCYLDYSYKYSFFSGSGSADAFTDNNSAYVIVAFNSPNSFDVEPPTSLEIVECSTNINIADLDFRGGFVAGILDTFESLIRGTIKGEVQGVACDELRKMGDALTTAMLRLADSFVDPYLEGLPPQYADPLHAEENLKQVPDEVRLLDFENPESSILGGWFDVALALADDMLGSVKPDGNSPTGNNSDLGINSFLRNNLLDANRAFLVNISDFQDFAADGVLYSGQDTLTETKITLDSIKVFGLDSFTRFEPLYVIGNYTLQSNMTWSFLSVEAQLTVEIKPSTLPDSLIANPGAARVVETIVVSLGADSIDAELSLFLAVDEAALGDLTVGSLLEIDNLVGCLLNSIFDAQVTGISVKVDDIREPTLTGFVSPGIDRVVSQAVKALFLMYEITLIDALPNMFQTTLRDIINKDIIKAYLGNSNNTNCPKSSFPGDFLDFRDLLLDPSDALAAGATGSEPYGNLGSTVMGLVKNLLFEPDNSSGLPGINSVLVVPLTQGQSGTPGTLALNDTIFDFVAHDVDDKVDFFVERFQFLVKDLRILDLDTITNPFQVLYPEANPHTLTNRLNMGEIPSRSLTVKLRMLIQLDKEGSPLAMKNEFDIVIKVPASSIRADFLAKIDASAVEKFPIQDLANLNCWLATLPPVDLDNVFQVIGPEGGFGISAFQLNMAGFALDAECVACESPGIGILPDLIKLLSQTGGVIAIREGIENLVEEIVLGDWVQTTMNQWVYDGPRLCPHSPNFLENAKPTDFGRSGLPNLSREAAETVVMTAAMAAEVGFLIFAERHRKSERMPTDPLSGQARIANVKKPFIDFTNLSDSFLGQFADTALDGIRNLLNETIKEGMDDGPGVRLNQLLRDYLLTDGGLSIVFTNESFSVAGVQVALHSLTFVGLDSATAVEVLKPMAPQTLRNLIRWKRLSLELNVELTMIGVSSPEMMTLSLGIEDVEVDLAVLVAMDEDVLGSFELGSLLKPTRILNCILKNIDGLELTQMSLSVGKVVVPTLQGFLSDDATDKVTESVRSVFETYQDELIEALPIIADESLRVLLNGALKDYQERKQVTCERYDTTKGGGSVDFRDLFLPESDAMVEGGKGGTPYGSLMPFVKKLLEQEFLAPDSITGKPRVNSEVIQPITRAISGVEGSLVLAGELVTLQVDDAKRFGLDVLELRLFDARFDNLDSVGEPFSMLEPTASSGQIFDNGIIFGKGPSGMSASVRVLLEALGDPALSTRNEMFIGLELRETAVALSLLAHIRENALMTYPLEDILNFDCWLAAFSVTELDENGIRLSGSEPSLAIHYLSIAIEQLRLNITCTNCTSEGLGSLSGVTDIFQATGAVEEFDNRLSSLSSELLKSELIQTLIDRLISDSSKRCPHSASYVENYTAPSYSGLLFPALSRDSIETAIFTGALALDMASVLLAMSHNKTEVNTDPLSGQELLEYDDDLRLLNLSALGGIIGSWADSALEEMNSYFGGVQRDSSGPNGDTDLGINVLLRSFVLDSNRTLTIEFEGLSIEEGGMELRLNEVRILGMDTFTQFKALDFIADQTMQNIFEWKHLSLDVDISILSDSDGQMLEPEDLTISLGLSDVTVSTAILLAINQDRLGSLELGSMLKLSQILPCALSTAHNAELTELDVTVKDVDGIQVKGFLSSRLDNILRNTTESLLGKYKPLIIETIPKITGSSIRAVMNNWIAYYINMNSSVACPSGTKNLGYEGGFIDFRDLLLPIESSRKLGGSGDSKYGEVVHFVLDLVKKYVLKIDANDGTASINDLLIAPLTKAQSGQAGTFRYEKHLLDTGTRIDIGGFQADIGLKAYNARIEALDSVGSPLSILDPMDGVPNVLNNTASIGVGGRPLRFGITLLIFVTNDDDLQMRNEVDISVDLSSASLVMETLLRIGEHSMLGFPVKDMLNLQCWLATLPAPILDSRGVRVPQSSPSAAITEMAVYLAHLGLNITCISCSSPKIVEFTSLLSTQAAEKDLNRVANDVLKVATQLVNGEFLQMQIDRVISEAPRHCPHRQEYDANANAVQYEDFENPDRTDDTINFLITLAIITGCLIIVVIAIMAAVKCIVSRRNRKWVCTLPHDKLMLLHRIQSEEREKEEDLNGATRSLFQSEAIPLYIRCLVPVVIIGNIGFFLSGHLSLGATVNIQAQVAGEALTIENFFEFSMAKSTIDIWIAGGKSLAILLALFSGVWPYTKQIMTLFLWFAPPKLVSFSKRGSIFLWLDTLAKWSVVDIFVLIMSIAAFRVSIQSPSVAFLPSDFYSLDLLVVPLWGLYANMIAQLVSQVSSHFIIHYHRRVMHVASDEYDQRQGIERAETGLTSSDESMSHEGNHSDAADRKERLRSHPFARPHRGEKDRLIPRSRTGSTLNVAAGIMSLLIVVGCSVPSFSLEVLGIVGIVVESGQEFQRAITKHSVFTIVGLLLEQASFLGTAHDFVGLGTLCFLLILTVMIVPVLQALCLLRQWFSPITQKQRWRLFILIEGLQAWQYAEVYLIAIIVSTWQLGQVSEFMINSYCDGISGTFAQLAYYGILAPEDAQCFRVQAGIEGGTFVLAAAAIILGLMTSFVMKAVHQYERDNSPIRAMLEERTKLTTTVMAYTQEEIDAARRAITPPVVLFSDTYRWMLRREDSHVPSLMRRGLDETAKLGVETSFLDAARASDYFNNDAGSSSVMSPDDESDGIPRAFVGDGDLSLYGTESDDGELYGTHVLEDGHLYAPNQ